MRRLVYAMQSSGASWVTQCLAKPNEIAILDLFNNRPCPRAEEFEGQDVIIKVTASLYAGCSLDDHVRRFEPDELIVVTRNEDAIRRSLKRKSYGRDVAKKLALFRKELAARTWNQTIQYENAVSTGHVRSLRGIIRYNQKNNAWCRTASRHRQKHWGLGNIHSDETHQFVDRVEAAIESATNWKSNLKEWELNGIPRLSSLANLHLINNLASLSSAYLELGTYQGSSLVAASTGNDHLRAVGIDGFGCKYEKLEGQRRTRRTRDYWRARLLGHIGRIRGTASVRFFEGDFWAVDHASLSPFGPFDFLYYDGPHRLKPHCRAIGGHLDLMADRYIYVCDAYDMKKVRRGTQLGIKRYNLRVIRDWYLGEDHTSYDPKNNFWGAGFYLAVIEKKKRQGK